MRFTLLIAGSLVFLVSLPLAWRKVPMNKIYGIRTAASFASDQRWYDINAYGGKQMALWSLLIIAAGIAGFFLPDRFRDLYQSLGPLVLVAGILIPLIRVGIWSRRHGP